MVLTRRALCCWLPLLVVASLIGQVQCQQDWPSSTTGIAVLTCVGVVTAGLSAGIIYAICKEMGHCNESKVGPLKVTKEVKKTPANRQKAAEQAQKKAEAEQPRMEQQTARSEMTQPQAQQNTQPASPRQTSQPAPQARSTNAYVGQQYGGYDDRGNVVGNIII